MADAEVLRVLSIFSGVGGLDLGFERAARRVGFDPRPVGYVEREAFAAACLVAAMERGELAPAPLWVGDVELCRYPAADVVVAGFPCPPVSHAGKRRGVEDERWLWPEVVRAVRDSGARLVALENVRGLLSANDGSAFAAVLGDLADLGFDAEWTMLRASDVGAPHRRARVFVLGFAALVAGDRRPAGADRERAHRHADVPAPAGRVAHAREPDARPASATVAHAGRPDSGKRGAHSDDVGGTRAPTSARGAGRAMDVPERAGLEGRDAREPPRAGAAGSGVGLADAEHAGQRGQREGDDRSLAPDAPGDDAHGRDPSVADAGPRGRAPLLDAERGVRAAGRGEADALARGGVGGVADADVGSRSGEPRLERGERADVARRSGWPCPWPPGPGERDRWRDVIAADPGLAPAVVADVRGVADGLPARVDAAVRTDRLRALGNAVVPAQAEAAFVELFGRIDR